METARLRTDQTDVVIAVMRIRAAMVVAAALAGQRPRNHPATARRRKAASRPIRALDPAICVKTQTSQMTVAKMGMETACLRTSIHAPGLGRKRAQPGKYARAR
jgi:hypothetical protein